MAKTHDQVMPEMNRILCEVLDDESIQLKRETTARDVKNWDSLHHVELVVSIERHFNIRFNFAEIQKFKNVGEWCDNIVAKLAQKATDEALPKS